MKNLYLLLLSLIFIGCNESDLVQQNTPPILENVGYANDTVLVSDTVHFNAIAHDIDGDDIIYQWSSSSGEIYNNDMVAVWFTPDTSGIQKVTCKVSDFDSDGNSLESNLHVYSIFDLYRFKFIGDWELEYTWGQGGYETPESLGYTWGYYVTLDSIKRFLDENINAVGTYSFYYHEPNKIWIRFNFDIGVHSRSIRFEGNDRMIHDNNEGRIVFRRINNLTTASFM